MAHKIITKMRDDVELWRYMDLPKLLSLLSSKSLWLARSDTFKDNREGFFSPEMAGKLKKIYEDFDKNGPPMPNSGINNSNDYQDFVRINSYLSCWHRNADENMIMWEIYGQSENAVAIKTTSNSLKNSLNLNSVTEFGLGMALDDVSYENYSSIKSEENSRTPFFVKQPHFAFEKEVRLYLRARNSKIRVDEAPLGYSILVDLNRLIKTVYVHPDAAEWFVKAVKNLLKKYDISVPVIKGNCGNS